MKSMNTTFLNGVKPGTAFRIVGRPFALGQALSQADRDHYLVALNRGLAEVDEIAAWLNANPNTKLKPSDTDISSGSDVVISPYFTKWVNFQAVRPDMIAFRDRLKNEDPASWASITDAEHTTFGWVSVIDQIFSAFKADPKNLTAGRWVAGVRQPDPVIPGGAPSMPLAPINILGLELPPTLLGMPTQTALVVSTVGLLGIGVALWGTFRKN